MLSLLGDRWHTRREGVTLGESMPRLQCQAPAPRTDTTRTGIFLVELAGCDRTAWEWARARGAFPFLESLLEGRTYRAVDYHAGCPWCRLAREAELLHGLPGAVAGEVFLPLGETTATDLARRSDALAFSTRLERRHEGLLRHGSAWGTFLPGGASPEEFHGLLGGREEGWVERLRNRIGAALDLRRGLAMVHLRQDAAPPQNLSPSGLLSWWARQDRHLALLHARALLSRRRDYETWILLSPGPAHGDAFPADYARRLQTAFGDAWRVVTRDSPPPPVNDARPLRLLARDGVAHLYVEREIGDTEKMRVARLILQAGGGVGAVLWRDSDGTPRWQRDIVAEPGLLTPPDAPDLKSWLPYLIERDAEALLDQPESGSWLALRGEPASWRRGGVAIVNRRARAGVARGDWLRPSQIYAASRHALGREELRRDAAAPALHPETLRLATYNIHRCIGMDGRRSIRRVLRVLAEIDADLVALQEVSAVGFNQAEHIAAELGLHVAFCPTLQGEEAYGHALLSRRPFTVNAVDMLPLARPASCQEPRGAIWARIQMGLRSIHVVSTHLALGSSDRTVQVDALLGPRWLGALPPGSAVVLCGDFNFAPAGRNYRRVAARLRDAQLAHSRGSVLNTFSTVCAVTRLDHIFLSPHFSVSGLASPRTLLTRVASDHFPLVADLRWPLDDPA